MGVSKYHNRKITIHGRTFDSQKEGWRFAELLSKQNRGEVCDLRCQVPFELIPKQKGERAVKYIADFVYSEDGRTVVEDVKGYRTKEYIIKRKLFKWLCPEYLFREV